MKEKSSGKHKSPTRKKGLTKHLLFFVRTVIISFGCVLLIALGAHFYTNNRVVCANSISCINDLSGKISEDPQGVFMGKPVQALNSSYFAQNTTPSIYPVLGTTDPDSKRIYVDLTEQKVMAFDGNTLVYTFPVSTGKWGRTPTGTFRIWIKLQATRMAGGSGADYYNLPNVPWTMFFANNQYGRSAGYSLHGAYWHNNFGHPMSHGCVNISPANAKLLYDWANPPTVGWTTYANASNPGTMVTIYGTTPNE